MWESAPCMAGSGCGGCRKVTVACHLRPVILPGSFLDHHCGSALCTPVLVSHGQQCGHLFWGRARQSRACNYGRAVPITPPGHHGADCRVCTFHTRLTGGHKRRGSESLRGEHGPGVIFMQGPFQKISPGPLRAGSAPSLHCRASLGKAMAPSFSGPRLGQGGQIARLG